MRRFSVIGTAHMADPRLLQALEAALHSAAPDQLILEMPDETALRDEVDWQKPEMAFAHRWATARGIPMRGHEPAQPSILRGGLSPERIAGLVQEMDDLVRDLTPRRTIDIFCGKVSPVTPTEARLDAIIGELVDPAKAMVRTYAIIAAVQRLSAREGHILILCGGAHTPHVAAALPGCRIIHGEHFF